MPNQVVKSTYDKNELRHWGVKGMKWAEKNKKALPASDFQEKARVMINENLNPKPKKWTKLEEANARAKIKSGETSPELYGLTKSEIRQFYLLSPEDQEKFNTLMKEKVAKGAIINGREVLEKFNRDNKQKAQTKVEVEEKAKSKVQKTKKRKASVETFLSSIGLKPTKKK